VVPERSRVHGVATPTRARLMFTRADGDNDAACVSAPDDDVLRLRRAVHEVPLPQRPLLALDDQQRLAGQDEEVFLVGFPVVQPDRLTRREHVETYPDLRELRFALEGQALSPPAAVAPTGLAGVQDEPAL